jgi:hypothetical protein
MRTGQSKSAGPESEGHKLHDIPIFWYKKATQVFDTAGVDKEFSGYYPPAAGGGAALKRTKSL